MYQQPSSNTLSLALLPVVAAIDDPGTIIDHRAAILFREIG
jgi:hypothetical protein